MNRKITLLFALIIGALFSAKAQCPPNIDFELGTTADWLYYRGTVASGPVFYVTACAPQPSLHTITTLPGTDYYGGFPVVSPGGGLHSLKLGKDSSDLSTMRCAYNVHVPTTAGVWSLVYRYAAVLENPPSGHTTLTEPRFVVTAFDSATGTVVPCTTYDYVGDGSQPGFLLSSIPSITGTGTDVWYKSWTLGNMKFPGLGGHTVTVQFTAAGCAQTGHFGYGYLDMSCGFFANSVISCASGTTTLTGPDGFSAYNWYDSSTFSTSYGSGQSVGITSPTVQTTYAVILTPFPGYGCTDTLYTVVIPTTIALNPTHDTSICSGTSLTLTSGATSTYAPITYLWGPSTGLSCVTCANPVATPTVSTNYYVNATDANGCSKTDTIHVTVFATPGPITGATSVCLGQTIGLSDSPPGGVWTSSSSTTASITSVTGIVTGGTVGVATITYTLGGSCLATRPVTVLANPAPIGGTGVMCIGTSTTLTDVTTGGTWSSTSGLISVVGAGTLGIVTGLSAGTATVTYTVGATGCFVTKLVTVNPSPGLISGLSSVCAGGTITLGDITAGGTWSASPTTTGTITTTTGIVTGIAAGPLVVTYTLATGCTTTTTVNVLPTPAPIVGPSHVCIGDTIILTDATGGGSWVASTGDVAIPDPSTGLIIGEPSGGTTIISYTAGASPCPSVYPVTVNPYASAIGVAGGASPQVCVGQTLLLNDADPGTWSSSNLSITTVGTSSGIVNGLALGNDTVTFTNSATGCRARIGVTVNPLPAAITGPTSLCVGTSITLTDATVGGTFSLGGSAPYHASVTGGGVVTGVSVGTQSIVYTSSLGCTTTYTVTVNTTPPPISGVLNVCQGGTTVLCDGIAGGVWSTTPISGSVTLAPVTCVTVTGVSAGTANVTYALGLGCFTSVIVTINPMPGAIVPATPVVCVGSNTLTLADPTTPLGTWSPVTGTNANINAVTGNVTGVSAGLQVFTYTAPSGCQRTTTVNVNPLPLAITGATSVCVGATITLNDATGGGTWTSLNTAQATIVSSTGVLTGVSPITATITYKITTTGCATATVITINPIPPLFTVTGGGSFCAGGTGANVCLTGSTSGVNYQLYVGGVATGSPLTGTGSSICFGPQTVAGIYTVIGSYPATGCGRTMTGSATVSVNPLPVITGPTALCVGATILETSSIPSSTWISSIPGNATIGATTGIVTGVTSGGSTVITLTSPAPASCHSSVTVNVTPSPGAIVGSSTVCVGDSTLFTDTPPGGSWSTSSPTIAGIGSLTGWVYGISSGPATITYSLGSGCQQTKGITVIAGPLAINPVAPICQGATVILHDPTPGGTWSVDAGSSTLATVIPGTGALNATITGGSTTTQAAVLYTMPATGCHSWEYVTINPLPSSITGPMQVCVASTTTLTDATPGGAWSILAPSPTVATISGGTVTGVVSGPSPATVSYTVLGCAATASVTVNPLPAAIGAGTGHVCQGQSVTLTDATPGGTWTITSGTPPFTLSGAVVTGSATGTGTGVVAYTLATGCSRNTTLTVNTTPAPIVGLTSTCVGNGAALSDPTPGGTWSSSNSSIAAIGAGTGIITTSSLSGTVTISYTLGSCAATMVFNVLNPPLPIAGSLNVCVGSTTALTDPTPGGVWSSGTPSLATINATSGIVTGISSGTVIITYGASGCPTIAPVVVNPISPVIGDSVVCQGQTIGLTDATLGGVWTSATPSYTSVVYTTGIVTGIAPTTTALINYTIPATGCTASRTVTVNPLPSPISGPVSVCVGQPIILHDITPGGGWSSSNTAIATIDGTTGTVFGVAGGTVTMTYTLSSTGCVVTYPITVNALPSAIDGPDNVCLGSSATYTDISGLGNWTSSATTVATIGFTSGVLTASATTTGTTTIVFNELSTGCQITKPVNVINPPSAIYTTAPPVVCAGYSFYLYDSSGTGTWSSDSPAIANVDATSGLVTGVTMGTATITYSSGTGCNAVIVVTVNQQPTAISGSDNICVGQTIALSSYPATGAWSSSMPAYGSIDALGNVTGVAAGSTTITYTLADGCSTNRTEFINATPPDITGINMVCVGLTTALADAEPGGTWASSITADATVDATGLVTGIAPGVTTISYTVLGTTCPATLHVTVNPVPSAITGTLTVCQGLTTTLHDAIPGSGWTSDNTAIATVDASGVVTGIAGGTADISYTLGADCAVGVTVTVVPVPSAISGADSVCQGQYLLFTDPSSPGAWSSSDTSVATISGTSGIMYGVAAGNVNITYMVNGCVATHPVTVDVQPTAITGNPTVCLGGTSPLSDAVTGGSWSSTFSAIAPVSTSGVVFGSALGTSTIIYTIYPGGCVSTKVVNVVPLPLVFTVSGGGAYCAGGTGMHITLSGSVVGVNYLLYRGITATGTFPGTGAALDFGLQTVVGTYTVIATTTATGCSNNMAGSVMISTIPNVTPSVSITAVPGDTVCTGTSITFTPTPVNGGTTPLYQWMVNGVNVATTNTYAFIPANGDTVAVTLTSNAICPLPNPVTKKQGLVVQPYADPSLTIIPHPGDTVCQGSPVSFTINPVHGGNAPTYIWMKNGVNVMTGPGYTYIPVNNDVVYAIMDNDYPCALNSVDTSVNVVMTIDTPMQPVVTIHVSPNTIVSVGQTVTMTATATNTGVAPTYQWYNNSVPVLGATNAVYTSSAYTTQEEDSVSCQVTSSGFCPVTGHQWVYIEVANVGVNQLSSASGDIIVVPNPNKGDFIIKGTVGANDEEVSLELTDVLGQVVYKNKLTAMGGKLNEHVVLSSKLANGMYVLSVRTASDSKVFHMVIEQ